MASFTVVALRVHHNGLFTLTQMDLGTDTDSAFNPKATLYYAEHVHIVDSDLDAYFLDRNPNPSSSPAM